MKKKSMILACILNFIPGIGLIYADKKVMGIIFILMALFGLLISLTGILAIIGLPMFLFAEIVGGFSTVYFIVKYPGGWKWL